MAAVVRYGAICRRVTTCERSPILLDLYNGFSRSPEKSRKEGVRLGVLGGEARLAKLRQIIAGGERACGF